jgi:hypothetical protein
MSLLLNASDTKRLSFEFVHITAMAEEANYIEFIKVTKALKTRKPFY